MASFGYDAAVIERFPTIVGGVVHAAGLANGPAPDELRAAFAAEQAAMRARLGDPALADVPSLAAWRRAFRTFGVDPTAYRSAPEALLRRLTKQGSIPSISTLVDLGNLVSVRHALPVAVFDLERVTGGLTVRLATGEEWFTDLGSGERERPEPGEVIFVDEVGLVCARRWCWRQSAESASGPATTEVLIVVEGLHAAARDDVTAAVADLSALLPLYARPATIASTILDASAPSTDRPMA